MTLWLPIVALVALDTPGLAVAVTGDDALADEVAAVQRRLQESFADDVRLVPDARGADLDVHLHRVDAEHLQLTIQDGDDVVVDQVVDGSADTRWATAWVIVRAAVDRALIDDATHDGGDVTPPPLAPTTPDAAPATLRSPWSADVCAGTTVSLAPDATLGLGADLGLGAAWQRDTWVRVGVDAGYRAFVGAGLVHTLPVGVRAAFGAPLDATTTVAPYGEAWVAARPALFAADAQGGPASLHTAVGVGVGVRVRGVFGSIVAARAGVELRTLQATYTTTTGDRVVDSVIALPATVTVGVPLSW